MITLPDLRTSLLDLLHELAGTEIKLIIGGGFGIYLKAEYVQKKELPTLLKEWPEARSTNDIDLFLRAELLINSPKLAPLSKAILLLGYKVIQGAEKYQFAKPDPTGSGEKGIKIDILTGPRSRFIGTKVKTDVRRVRPQPSVDLHAHPVDEVPTLEQGLLALKIQGNLTDKTPWESEVYIPHPFSYLMMKLFAFSDRVQDPDKEYGRYHALDLYTITATMTEIEWKEALKFREDLKDDPFIIKAAELVETSFSDMDKMGLIRLRENRYFRPQLQITEFISAMKDLFPIS
jgi:hypothetical protein